MVGGAVSSWSGRKQSIQSPWSLPDWRPSLWTVAPQGSTWPCYSWITHVQGALTCQAQGPPCAQVWVPFTSELHSAGASVPRPQESGRDPGLPPQHAGAARVLCGPTWAGRHVEDHPGDPHPAPAPSELGTVVGSARPLQSPQQEHDNNSNSAS